MKPCKSFNDINTYHLWSPVASLDCTVHLLTEQLQCNVKITPAIALSLMCCWRLPCYGVVSHCPCDSYSKFPFLPSCAVHRQIPDLGNVSVDLCEYTVQICCAPVVCVCVLSVARRSPTASSSPYQRDQHLRRATERAPCSIPVFCTTSRRWPTHSSSSPLSFPQVRHTRSTQMQIEAKHS